MKRIPLVKPEFDVKKLCRDFKKIAQSGILTRGPFLTTFEKKLAQYLKIKHVFATSSCTTALHLALVAGGISKNDEVLVSDFSFPASGNVIAQIGAKPVFVDINLETFCLNVDDLAKKITKKTKAIEVVHAFGYPANMTEIMKLAKKHKLLVIEDAACALGSKHRGRYLGTWGDVGCFSFHPRKNITTGEGGAIVTNNAKIAEKIEILRNHGGLKTAKGWEFQEIGFNYRLSELQAALGVEQMLALDRITKERQKVARKYLEALQNVPEISLPQEPKDGLFNFQSFVILLPKDINRDELIKYLAKKNIETTIGTYAQHAQKSFRGYGYEAGDLPNSFYAYKHSLTLPLYGQMTDKEIEYVVENVAQALACKNHAGKV